MVNSIRDQTTEDKIMNAAIKVFTEKGLAGARMQEIADAANVNKAMVHYYYRSKSNLFNTILKSKVKELFKAFAIILQGDGSFEEKIRSFVKQEIDFISLTPGLPLFVLNEVGKNPGVLQEVFKENGPKQMIRMFRSIVDQEISKGTIRPITFEELLINIMSLCLYPFVARPILQHLFDMTEDNFSQLVEGRKTTVSDLIINDIIINRKL